MRFVLPDPRIGEDAVHLAAGDAPRIGVGDHDGAQPGNNSLNISAVRGRVPTPITSALVSVVR